MRRIALTLAAFATAALFVAQSMSASPPKQAQGTEVTIAAATTDARMADGNLIEERVATRLLTEATLHGVGPRRAEQDRHREVTDVVDAPLEHVLVVGDEVALRAVPDAPHEEILVIGNARARRVGTAR